MTSTGRPTANQVERCVKKKPRLSPWSRTRPRPLAFHLYFPLKKKRISFQFIKCIAYNGRTMLQKSSILYFFMNVVVSLREYHQTVKMRISLFLHPFIITRCWECWTKTTTSHFTLTTVYHPRIPRRGSLFLSETLPVGKKRTKRHCTTPRRQLTIITNERQTRWTERIGRL